MPARPAAKTRGHTLLEMVVAVTVSGVLIAGLMSTLYVASRAASPGGSSRAVLAELDAADELLGDLVYAVAFTERSASAVEFTVADRNGDNTPETIRYAWSGTPGDPLTRQYNGGTAVEIVSDVQEFTLSYHVRTRSEQPPPGPIEGAETLLVSHDPASSPLDFPITDKEWIGQYFLPSLPADAVEWKVTRVGFNARVHGGTKGITSVQLRLPTASNLPGDTVLEAVPMYESNLADTYSWQEFPFGSVSGLAPSQGLCLVLALQHKEAHLADIQYDDGGGAGRLTTTNAGSSWSGDGSRSMVYAVYGTVTAPALPDPITREWLRTVGVKLRVGTDPSASVQTAVPVLNAPEVTAP